MSETTETDKDQTWEMPEPVFRSTEGRRPGDAERDIPTEPGFAPAGPEGDESGEQVVGVQTVRPSTKQRIRHKKKAAPSNPVRTTIIVIILSLIVLVVSLVYLLFFYRPIGR